MNGEKERPRIECSCDASIGIALNRRWVGWQASAARFSEIVAATQLALHEMDEQSSRRGHTSEEFFEAERRLRKALESVPELEK